MTAALPPAAELPALESVASPRLKGSLRLVGWLAASWVLLLIVGFFMLRDPSALAASNRVSPARAAFTSINVGALAGFASDFAKPDDFSKPVQVIFVLQTLCGLLLSLVGGGVLLARLLNRTYSDGRLTATALLMMVAAFAVGVTSAEPGTAIAGGFRGLSALGCGGILFGDVPPPGVLFTGLLVPLSLIGSLGVVVVTDIILALLHKRPLGDHGWRVLTLTAGVYLLAMLAMLLVSPPGPDGLVGSLLRNDGLFWTAHAWGMPLTFASSWHGGLIGPLLVVMLIGVGTAGTAGAMGLGWIITLPARLRNIAFNGLTAQAVLAAATLAILAFFEPTLPPIRRALLVGSAVMNLGLSHEPLTLTGLSLFTLAACIAMAKLLPLVVLALALRSPSISQKENS